MPIDKLLVIGLGVIWLPVTLLLLTLGNKAYRFSMRAVLQWLNRRLLAFVPTNTPKNTNVPKNTKVFRA